jgi:glyoxylate/hydroxypyruvate reductase A
MRILVVSSDGLEAEPLLRAARPDVDWVCVRRAEDAPSGAFDAIFGARLPRTLFERVTGVRWVQWWAAGVDRTEGVPETVLLTRIVDLFSRGMAEYVIGALLDWVKNGPEARRQQARREWKHYRTGNFAGQLVGVAGAGSIGGAVAEMAHRLSARVWTLASKARSAPYTERAFAVDQVTEFLGELDALVLVLPLTPATHHFMNQERFRALKPGAALVNVGRGGLVDERALLEGLEHGQPAHAYLDVVEEEPLPPGSPLWVHPGVTITPHISGPNVLPVIVKYSLDNLARWERREALVGVVNRARGY